MRTCLGPGSPTGRSSTCSTSGPPCLWKRIALAMLFLQWMEYLVFFRRVAAAGGTHRLERRALQLEALDRELHHVEVHVEPDLDRAQLGDALLDFLGIE